MSTPLTDALMLLVGVLIFAAGMFAHSWIVDNEITTYCDGCHRECLKAPR